MLDVIACWLVAHFLELNTNAKRSLHGKGVLHDTSISTCTHPTHHDSVLICIP